MNANKLKSRASRLMARLNAMGFTKDGKPLVIDQAYELVAAEEGHRNQHVFRAHLAANPELVIPHKLDAAFAKAVCVVHTLTDDDWDFASQAWGFIVAEAKKRGGTTPATAESERAAEQAWGGIVNRMGWDDRSEVLHLEGFIRERGLMGEMAQYAEAVAAEEQSFVDESDSQVSEAAIAVLKAVGYRIAISDYKRPYWDFDGYGSLDFDTEAEAWADAWEHAQNTVIELSAADSAVWPTIAEHLRISAVAHHLSRKSADRLRTVADQAFESYDFGEFLTVAGTSGWEWTDGDSVATRIAFLADSRKPEAASVRYRFTVEMKDGTVVETHLNRS